MTRFTKWWTNYWFRPTALINIAMARIIIIGFQLIWLLIRDFPSQIQQHAAMPDFQYEPLPLLRLFTLPFGADFRPDASLMLGVFVFAVVIGFVALVGFRAKLSMMLFALSNLFLQTYLYSFQEFHHPEGLVLIALFVLALGPVGGVLSVDAYLRERRQPDTVSRLPVWERKSVYARWTLLLMQWIVVLAYVSAALAKAVNGGPDWVNGYTLRFYMLQDGIRWDVPLAIWLSEQHTIAILLSIGSVFFEATFILAAIFPRLVWFYIPAGIAFHTGIFYIQRAPFFGWLAVYAVFIPWDQVARWLMTRRTLYQAPTPNESITVDGTPQTSA